MTHRNRLHFRSGRRGLLLGALAAPVLVLVSFVLGPSPMALVFNGFELGAIFLAVLIAATVSIAQRLASRPKPLPSRISS